MCYDRVVSDRRGLPYSEGIVVKDINDPVGAAWYKRTLSLSRYCPEMVANLPPAPAPSKSCRRRPPVPPRAGRFVDFDPDKNQSNEAIAAMQMA